MFPKLQTLEKGSPKPIIIDVPGGKSVEELRRIIEEQPASESNHPYLFFQTEYKRMIMVVVTKWSFEGTAQNTILIFDGTTSMPDTAQPATVKGTFTSEGSQSAPSNGSLEIQPSLFQAPSTDKVAPSM